MNTSQPTIYYNPKCSKSRKTLELLQERGFEPVIIHYLNNPPSKTELLKIVQLLNLKPRNILRTNEQVFIDAGMDEERLSDDEIIEAIIDCPSLLQRPIVIYNEKAVLGRPPENVFKIL